MLKYGLGLLKNISNYARKEVILPTIMVGAVLLSSCSFDLMDRYNKLERRENTLKSELADIQAKKQKYVDGLTKIVQKIVTSQTTSSEEQGEE